MGEDPAKWSGDNLNFYAYAQNRPTLMVDPLGLLAEIYCERLGSGGSTWWQHILLFSVQAMHCYLRVKTECKDEEFEITGPFVNNKATPIAIHSTLTGAVGNSGFTHPRDSSPTNSSTDCRTRTTAKSQGCPFMTPWALTAIPSFTNSSLMQEDTRTSL